MMPLTSREIRERFLKFFEEHDHLLIPGAPLVPKNDPTLLFINSGMAPLKNYFLGTEKPPKPNLANVQACIRTRDIDDVGDRHHMTLFEMLGSWSIGGYYKEKATELAWKLLVDRLAFPKDRLLVSVFGGDRTSGLSADEETVSAWERVGVPRDRIVLLSEDNFWGPAGETGPCGPCTEVFFDTGPEYGPEYRPGGVFDSKSRYIEIWNAGVFMEFNKGPDGKFTSLPLKSVDTGSGLERMEMVMRGVTSVYDTSLLRPLISLATQGFPSGRFSEREYRILVDHLRAVVFMVSEHVVPSNEGRGYIPRRLLRKSISIALRSERGRADFSAMIDAIIDAHSEFYPHLRSERETIHRLINQEVSDFEPTVRKGLAILKAELEKENRTAVSGALTFDLVTTHGLPLELVCEVARADGRTVDEEKFRELFSRHQEISRSAPKLLETELQLKVADLPETEFLGYEATRATGKILAVLSPASRGDAIIITDVSCSYGESGGQVGDTGAMSGPTATARILDTKKLNGRILHTVQLISGNFKPGDQVEIKIDPDRRALIRANHSATHLVQSALRKLLGAHVQQRGSLVDAERLRFDFEHPKPVTIAELGRIERRVNEMIRANHRQLTRVLPIEEAKKTGAMALFTENYGAVVRVVELAPDSLEFCGGTHVSATGEIGCFLITSESSVAKGVRRIEGVTGDRAIRFIQERRALLGAVCEKLGTAEGQLLEQIERLKAKPKAQPTPQRVEVDRTEIRAIGSIRAAFMTTDSDVEGLKSSIDQLIRAKEAEIACGISRSETDSRVVIAVAEGTAARLPAHECLKAVLVPFSGKGGGKATFAQGAAPLGPEKIEALFALVEAEIVRRS